MKMISVIVPVYKVEDYLDRCVKSIVNQTYHNLEVILVDDGSPDNCPIMCDDWAEKDRRIRVIHKKNGGLSDARNAGLAIATGEYIGFVDSDDWIADEMYEQLYEAMERDNSDIASCDALRVWENGRPGSPIHHFSGNHVLEGDDALKALIESTYLVMTVWNKLYKSCVIKDIPFEKGKIHEDEFWSWQVIAKAKRVSVLEDSWYYYLQRNESIMGNGYTGDPMTVINAKLLRNRYIHNNRHKLLDVDNLNLLYTCYFQCCQVLKYEDNKKRRDLITKLQGVARECFFSSDFLKKQTRMKRTRIFLIRHYLPTVCRIDILLKKA